MPFLFLFFVELMCWLIRRLISDLMLIDRCFVSLVFLHLLADATLSISLIPFVCYCHVLFEYSLSASVVSL